jgi:signal transduction histidine kinase
MSTTTQPVARSRPYPLPWDSASASATWERELAAAALHFTECLDLPIVLDRVAQRTASLFGGVCQVRFAPAHRPQQTRRAVATVPGELATNETGATGERYAGLLTWLDEQIPPRLSQCLADEPAAWQGATRPVCRESHAGEALLLAPLVARGRRVGTIDIVIHAALSYDLPGAQRWLWALAAHAAMAIDTADQMAQLRPPDSDPGGKVGSDDQSALLAMIAHDLKGPLATLSSSIQLLLRAAKGTRELEKDKILRLVELAEAAVGQLEAQIGALRPARAASAPSSSEPTAPVDLVGLVRLVANFYQQTTGRHHLAVAAEVAELHGPWSRGHMERVISNLLANAIKYSPASGEIQITVGREEDAMGSWATLNVGNHGIGIPAADMARLSQPGYRAKNVGSIPGTGFGLASVREIVEQYGGTCAIRSATCGATLVQIRLPLAGGAHP